MDKEDAGVSGCGVARRAVWWSAVAAAMVVVVALSAKWSANLTLRPGRSFYVAQGHVGYAWWNEEKMKIHPTEHGLWKGHANGPLLWLPNVFISSPDYREVGLPMWPAAVVAGILAWRARQRGRAGREESSGGRGEAPT